MRLAIPNKGRIADPIIELVEAGGLKIENSHTRKLISRTSDPEIEVLFARPIDIPEYVAIGAADIGITGRLQFCFLMPHMFALSLSHITAALYFYLGNSVLS